VTNTSDRSLTIASWTFVVVAGIAAIQGLVDGLPRHGVDPTWPDHARFHVTWATFSKIGFCITTAAVALIPFRRAERWSWWTLLTFVVLGMYSLIPAAMWQGSGPQEIFAIPLALAYTALLAALAISWRVGFPVYRDDV
jgi:hypothetical protein